MPDDQYFPQGDPVGPADVVDRDDFLGDLVARLADGQRILLAGPRRTGKTSLAKEAIRRLKAEGYYTAYVDLFGVESRSQFAERLVDALFENRSGVQKTLQAMRSLVSSAAGAAGSVDLKFRDFDLAFSLAQRKDDALFDESLDLAQQIAEADERRVVVVLDEFQDFAKLGGDAVFKRLRSHFQQHAYVSYLFLGSQAGAMRELFGKGRQALFRFAMPLDLPPIPAAAWIEYMDRKFRGRGLQPTEMALRHLIDKTGGHPSDTMMVCEETLRAVQQVGASIISVEIVEVGYERSLQHLRLAFDEIWGGFSQQRPSVQLLAGRIARGEHPYPKGEHSQTVTRALDVLTRTCVVEKVGRGDYRFTEPMLAESIRRRTSY